MNTVFIVLLLLAFSVCVIVGLLTVLQQLVNGDYSDESGSTAFQDGAEQQGIGNL